jgi:hypothetical protein
MGRKAVAAAFSLALCTAVATLGCAPAQAPRPAPEAPKPVAEAPRPPEPALDPRVARQLSNELVRDVTEYYRLLKEKRVEQATAYASMDRRQALQDELWGFVARYTLSSADIATHELHPTANTVVGKVKVYLTLFGRDSVVPERTEAWTTWEHRQGRWVLLPRPSQ